MGTECIEINGERVKTLKELLCPHVKAVFVGLNPSPVSVAAGHYYQGRIGQRFWQRLQKHGITGLLPRGEEDDAAFAQGFGFADIVRRPTPRARDLCTVELEDGALDLLRRLNGHTHQYPLVIFVFNRAANFAASGVEQNGYRTFRMPGPFAPTAEVTSAMATLGARLWSTRRCLC